MPTKKQTKRTRDAFAEHERRKQADYIKMVRRPTAPGKMLLDDYIKPLGLKTSVVAKRLGISPRRLDDIIRGLRVVTAELAFLLGREFKTTPHFWLNLQMEVDLWDAAHRMLRCPTTPGPCEKHEDDHWSVWHAVNWGDDVEPDDDGVYYFYERMCEILGCTVHEKARQLQPVGPTKLWDPEASPSPVTPAEVERRVATADAALGLAGHQITDPVTRDILRRAAAEEITSDEAAALINKHILGR